MTFCNCRSSCVCTVWCAWALFLSLILFSMHSERGFFSFSLLFRFCKSYELILKSYWIFSTENSIRWKQVLVFFFLSHSICPIVAQSLSIKKDVVVWMKSHNKKNGKWMKMKKAEKHTQTYSQIHQNRIADGKMQFDWHQCLTLKGIIKCTPVLASMNNIELINILVTINASYANDKKESASEVFVLWSCVCSIFNVWQHNNFK